MDVRNDDIAVKDSTDNVDSEREEEGVQTEQPNTNPTVQKELEGDRKGLGNYIEVYRESVFEKTDANILRTVDIREKDKSVELEKRGGIEERRVVDFDAKYVLTVVNRTSVFLENMVDGKTSLIDLSKYLDSKKKKKNFIESLYTSSCFNNNYTIVLTSNRHLLVFVLKENENGADLIRFPFKMKLPSPLKYKAFIDNVFYYVIEDKLQCLVFQEMPEKEFEDIDAEVIGNCCQFFEILTAKKAITGYDISTEDYFYISTGDFVTVFNDEGMGMFKFEVGNVGDKVVWVWSMTKDPNNNKNGSYIVSVSDKGDVFVHDLEILKKENAKTAKITSFNFKEWFDLKGGRFAFEKIGRRLIVKELDLKVMFSFEVNCVADKEKECSVQFYEPVSYRRDLQGVSFKQIKKERIDKLFVDKLKTEEENIPIFCSLDENFGVTFSQVLLKKMNSKKNVNYDLIDFEEPIEENQQEEENKDLFNNIDKELKENEGEGVVVDKLKEQIMPDQQTDQKKDKLSKMTGFMSLADVEKGMMQGTTAKPENPTTKKQQTFKQKLAQKRDIKEYKIPQKEKEKEKETDPNTTENQPEIKPKYEKAEQKDSTLVEPVDKKAKKKKKKSADEILNNEVFVKNLSELFMNFHDKLTKKVNRVMDDSKKTIVKDFQSSLSNALKDFKRGYGEEMATKSEKEIIPYLEKCIYKIFEKYTQSLEKTYSFFSQRIESESYSQQMLSKNLEAIFNSHSATATKLERAINLFMKTLERHDKQETIEKEKEGKSIVEMLQTISKNQQVMNNAFVGLNDRMNRLQSEVEELRQTQNNANMGLMKVIEFNKRNFTGASFEFDGVGSPKLTESKSELGVYGKETGEGGKKLLKKDSEEVEEEKERRGSVKNLFSNPYGSNLMFMSKPSKL